jgi:hypothetical protein
MGVQSQNLETVAKLHRPPCLGKLYYARGTVSSVAYPDGGRFAQRRDRTNGTMKSMKGLKRFILCPFMLFIPFMVRKIGTRTRRWSGNRFRSGRPRGPWNFIKSTTSVSGRNRRMPWPELRPLQRPATFFVFFATAAGARITLFLPVDESPQRLLVAGNNRDFAAVPPGSREFPCVTSVFYG